MENTVQPIIEIQKEDVVNLSFPSDPVISDVSEHKKLMEDLHKATSLGNISKHKVYIVFRDSEGPKKVNTTVWAMTEKSILLKKGVFLPIHRIVSVDLL